jgi:hypothetical protein
VTIVRDRYYPAQVRLPGGQVLSKTYVVLAEGGQHGGLTVYSRPDTIVYRAGIDWAGTPELPRTQRAARNGVPVRLDTGEVVTITPSTPCRCGQLGRWGGPSWATTVAARA